MTSALTTDITPRGSSEVFQMKYTKYSNRDAYMLWAAGCWHNISFGRLQSKRGLKVSRSFSPDFLSRRMINPFRLAAYPICIHTCRKPILLDNVFDRLASDWMISVGLLASIDIGGLPLGLASVIRRFSLFEYVFERSNWEPGGGAVDS